MTYKEHIEQVVGKLSDTMDPDGAAEMVAELVRAAWNARGVEDEDAVLAEFGGPTLECLRAAAAIRMQNR